jgi:hypothetical protein
MNVLRSSCALACLLALLSPRFGQAADRVKGATSGRAARQEAIQAMPLDQLAADDRAAVQKVLDDTTLYRKLPEQVVRCDAALFEMLINHPDVTASLWQELDVSRLSVERAGPDSFNGDDAHGTKGRLQFLHRSRESYLVYCEGAYEGSLLKRKVTGQCVVLMRVKYVQEDDGQYVTAQLDTFMRMEQVGVELVARTFQPLVGRVFDANFLEALKFASSLSRAAEVNPASTQALADRLAQVSEGDRQRLRGVLTDIGERGAVAAADQPGTREARADDPSPQR